jgi:hypothetical protein
MRVVVQIEAQVIKLNVRRRVTADYAIELIWSIIKCTFPYLLAGRKISLPQLKMNIHRRILSFMGWKLSTYKPAACSNPISGKSVPWER